MNLRAHSETLPKCSFNRQTTLRSAAVNKLINTKLGRRKEHLNRLTHHILPSPPVILVPLTCAQILHGQNTFRRLLHVVVSFFFCPPTLFFHWAVNVANVSIVSSPLSLVLCSLFTSSIPLVIYLSTAKELGQGNAKNLHPLYVLLLFTQPLSHTMYSSQNSGCFGFLLFLWFEEIVYDLNQQHTSY